jgi:hypothetical protein
MDRPRGAAANIMRIQWQKYDTGWGELLGFVLAWVVVLGAVWLDYASRTTTVSGDRVAATGGRSLAPSNID